MADAAPGQQELKQSPFGGCFRFISLFTALDAVELIV